MEPTSVLEEIEKSGERFPDHVALQTFTDDVPVRYTYRETLRLARNVTQFLLRRGIAQGDRVALWSRSGPQWAIGYLGILYSGAVVVPLDFDYKSKDITAILEETECRFVFTTHDKLPALREIVEEARRKPSLAVLDHAGEPPDVSGTDELFQDSPEPLPAPTLSPEDETIIFYTSGTTGKPKGVVIARRSLDTSAFGLLQYIKFFQTDNSLAIVPSHHIFATLANLLLPLAIGSTVTYLRAVNSAELLKTIQQGGITIFPGVPQVFYLLHKKIFDEVGRKPLPVRAFFKSALNVCYLLRRATGLNPGRVVFAQVHKIFGGRLRVLISAASYFDPKVIRDFYSLGFIVQQGYGLTETFGGGTFTPYTKNVIGSAGVPIPGVRLKIDGPDEHGVGEIAIAGSSLMRGYFKNPEATAAVLRDGWFYTGDLGYTDEGGNYYITGRSKDLIVLSSGKKVYPEEVELHYLQSPYIKEICVLASADPSNYARSERLFALVVPDFDYLKQQRMVNSKEIIRSEIEELSAALPTYKRILRYEIQAEPLPRTATRKVMRWAVQEQLAKALQREEAAPESRYKSEEGDDILLASERSKIVLEAIRGESRAGQELHPDMNLELDLGFDSLQRIELIANVEQSLGIRLGDDSASQLLTIRDLLKAINRAASAHDAEAGERVGGAPAGRITWKQILASAGTDDIAEEYVLKSKPFSEWTYFLFLKVVFVLAKILFRLKVEGVENIPRQRPYLLCPNHQSYLDGMLLSSVLPRRTLKHLFSLGYSPYFKGGIKNLIARIGKVVPIDPDTNLVRAMKVSAIGLKAEKSLLIFPEGSRSHDGTLQEFKKGAAILARELQVPVVPVAIAGAFQAWSKGSNSIRLVPIKITIGKALQLEAPQLRTDDHEKDYVLITQLMRDEVHDILARDDEPAGVAGNSGEARRA
jgi:long-chain acyl-CoA synthetase